MLLLSLALMAGTANPVTTRPSEDLKCMSSLLVAVRTLKGSTGSETLHWILSFYQGRLSVIDPNADWVWIATSEKPLPQDEEIRTIEVCGERMMQLTHVAPSGAQSK